MGFGKFLDSIRAGLDIISLRMSTRNAYHCTRIHPSPSPHVDPLSPHTLYICICIMFCFILSLFSELLFHPHIYIYIYCVIYNVNNGLYGLESSRSRRPWGPRRADQRSSQRLNVSSLKAMYICIRCDGYSSKLAPLRWGIKQASVLYHIGNFVGVMACSFFMQEPGCS